MHARKGQAGHLTIGGARLAALAFCLMVTAVALGALLQRYAIGPRAAAPAIELALPTGELAVREAAFVRENVNLLAAKVGALQARMVSMDGLSRRVAQAAGVAYTDPEIVAAQQGLPEATEVMDDLFTVPGEPQTASAEALGRQLDQLQHRISAQYDNLSMLDLALTRRGGDQARVPTSMPVKDYPYLSSSYGWRRNPVTGQYAMHEGLDFAAPPGTPILAASGGVVIEAKYQLGYGNMVEIDHGGGLVTRYAHAQRLLVKQGDVVERGQRIALVGSSGRSTGPHLHFEVRLAGQPLDPKLFLGTGSIGPAVAGAGNQATASAAQVR
ncbi:M23 family metallopeptidase [Orrella sp. JC864]|uniref:M23 family metallopeptidase n=1 Tax=Orrella sp. JC864 TaxID=3120298 RepID=UPI0012BD47D7